MTHVEKNKNLKIKILALKSILSFLNKKNFHQEVSKFSPSNFLKELEELLLIRGEKKIIQKDLIYILKVLEDLIRELKIQNSEFLQNLMSVIITINHAYKNENGIELQLEDQLIEILSLVNYYLKAELFLSEPMLLKMQLQFCSARFNENNALDFGSMECCLKNISSVLFTTEKILDYCLLQLLNGANPRLECLQMVHEFLESVFWKEVDEVLIYQREVYKHLLIILTQAGNLYQKVKINSFIFCF